MAKRFKTLSRRVRSARKSLFKTGRRGFGHTNVFLIGRARNLRQVQRRIIIWGLIVLLLVGASAVQILAGRSAFGEYAASDGGTYAEGTIGPIETLNPILATSSAEQGAGRLLFSGLFDYDTSGSIRPVLATGITTTDSKSFTVALREGLKWSDGEPFTSDDVVTTIKLIQNEAVRSPLASSWRGISVQANGRSSVIINLPSAYAPFVHSLTFGVLPAHILKNVEPVDIRTADFNLRPVTLGAFDFAGFRATDANGNPAVTMNANTAYFMGAPRVEKFTLRAYKDGAALARAYVRREVGAIAGPNLRALNDALKGRRDSTVTDAAINNGDYALFNTKNGVFADKDLRTALRQGTDTVAIRSSLGRVGTLDGPLLPSLVPATGDLKQATGDQAAAKTALDGLGWKTGEGGIRFKDGSPLVVRLVALNTGDYPRVSELLAAQWKTLGADVRVSLEDPATATERVLIPRAFDVLLYELAIGADPDVYAYWHSSQASSGGLNFSGYSSGLADDDLASARSTTDPALRATKYVSFVRQWLADTPAVALYRQSYHYVSSNTTKALDSTQVLINPTDRYANVDDWTVETARVFGTP